MTDSPLASPPPPRRNFVIYFMAIMLVMSAITFVAFTYVARSSKAQRREISQKNLQEIHHALKSFAADPQNKQQYPAEIQTLAPKHLNNPDVFSHPAWPNRAGYVYVPGVQSSDPPETIVVYENVPAGKEKLGRLTLSLNGEVHMWDEVDFKSKIMAQEALWKSQNRSWQPVAVEPLIQVK